MSYNHCLMFKYLKYCIVGAIGAILDFSIFTLLVECFLINYLISNIISISIALITVYYLQKNWTFQYIPKTGSKTFQRYLVSVAITYIFNNLVLVILIGFFGYDPIISKIIQIFISTLWGYGLTNYFVFCEKEEKSKE